MAHIDPLLERNKHFATTDAREGTSILAKYPVYVITCLDPGTDPSSTILPSTITVSGHVYDLTTGLLTTVLPAAPMHSATSDPTNPTTEGR